MLKSYIKGTHILSCPNYSRISTNLYCTLKMTNFFRFSYLQLRNIRWT